MQGIIKKRHLGFAISHLPINKLQVRLMEITDYPNIIGPSYKINILTEEMVVIYGLESVSLEHLSIEPCRWPVSTPETYRWWCIWIGPTFSFPKFSENTQRIERKRKPDLHIYMIGL